ncbi:MAG TPA: GTP-binding protein, partial [Candidatus Saccharimonadaceae bacterium]|nr:GTP-binding protein [Candidatus Saccharimonadaceae bacterium]
MNQASIRNFCIIAHIDHGKSTLADRMMELTGTVEKRDMKSQLLDQMDLEREKGITIKLAPVRMRYRGVDLNLIDTPGHVDFSYEVSRSLTACEGAVLVVDASQGIQAQTLANVYLAIEAGLEIIPVLNKVDLPAADIPRVSKEVINLLGCRDDDIIKVSAKTGQNVDQVLDAILERIPPPISLADKKMVRNNPDTLASEEKYKISTRALIFDSYYDDYRGVILYVRVVDGQIKKSDDIVMLATAAHGIALEVGHLSPKMTPDPALEVGEIGYIVTNLKTTRDARV